MKRHFPGLHADAAQANDFLEGIFLVRVDQPIIAGTPRSPSSSSASRSLRLRTSPPAKLRATLLHPEVPLETELVLARFRL